MTRRHKIRLFPPNQRLFSWKGPNLPLQGVWAIKWDCKRSQFCNRNCINTNHITKLRARNGQSKAGLSLRLKFSVNFCFFPLNLSSKPWIIIKWKWKRILRLNSFISFVVSIPFHFFPWGRIHPRCANATMTQPEQTLWHENKAWLFARYQFESVDIKTCNRTSHLSGLVKIQTYRCIIARL